MSETGGLDASNPHLRVISTVREQIVVKECPRGEKGEIPFQRARASIGAGILIAGVLVKPLSWRGSVS
jgi:hypothetical protein